MHLSGFITLLADQVFNHPIFAFLILPPTILLAYLVVNEIYRYSLRNRSFVHPPNRLVVGNLPGIATNAAEQLRRWSKKYGEVYKIQLGNVPVVVINSAEAAREILGRQGGKAGSRPVFWTFHQIVAKTAGSTIGTSPMSDSLKRRRRVTAAALNKPAVASYAGHLDRETTAVIKNLLEAGESGKKPIEPKQHIQRFALCMALTVNWGTRLASEDEELFKEIVEVERGIVSTRDRTQNLMDYIPTLRLLAPFSSRTKQVKDWRRRRDIYLNKFDSELRDQIQKGTHQPSIQANAILDPETKLTREELTSVSISIIQGGNDTVSGTLDWSLAYLSQHPEIQDRLLEELRSVYGEDDILCQKPPEKETPYLHALVRECLRYFTILRLSLPRDTTAEITYKHHIIPAGSTLWLNAWACNMDPSLWPDYYEFRPERWFERPDAPLFTYGWGSRMCAGYQLANRELEVFLMRVVSCFEVVHAEGEKVDAFKGGEGNGRSPRKYCAYFRPRDEKVLRGVLDGKDVGEVIGIA